MTNPSLIQALSFEQWQHARVVRDEVAKALRGESADLPLVAQFLDELLAFSAFGEEWDGTELSPEEEAAHREAMLEALKARGLKPPTWRVEGLAGDGTPL